MKKSLRDKIIKIHIVEEELRELNLSSHESELVSLKVSILLENRLLEWILSKLTFLEQKRMANVLMDKGEVEDLEKWLEERIPNFTKEAQDMIEQYQQELLTEIQQAIARRNT